MDPLVSILIPCHNAAPWLGAALESALEQTWPRTEIIVVDDGSSDGSLALARGFEERGVTVLAQPNRGAAAARNAALARSTGDWIQYLDADDLLAPDKLARQLHLACAVGDEYILSGTWARFRHSPDDAAFVAQVLCADSAPADWVVRKLEAHAMMHPAAWLLPRRLSDRAGPWNEALSLDDDGEYFTRAVLASKGVRHCPDAVSYYRSRLPGSLSTRKSDRAWASAFASLELSAQGLQAAEDSPRTRAAAATAYQRFIYEAYPGAPESRRRAAERAAALGGSALRPSGGGKFELLRRFVGWRLAKRILGHF